MSSSWQDARRVLEVPQVGAWLSVQQYINERVEEFVETLQQHRQWPVATRRHKRWFGLLTDESSEARECIVLDLQEVYGSFHKLWVYPDNSWKICSVDPASVINLPLLELSSRSELSSSSKAEWLHRNLWPDDTLSDKVVQAMAAYLIGRNLPLPGEET